MKQLSYIIIIALMFSSCKKFIDVNQSPNDPTDVPPKILLPTTTVGIAWANSNELGRAAEILVQHNAGINGNPDSYDKYELEGLMDNQWNFEIYNGPVNNLRLLIQKSNGTSPAYSGIAKLELAYIISVATDLFGDVPYSQAGLGLQFPQPRFDKQQDIYLGNASLGIQSLFDLVREGLADLDKTSALKPGSDDIVYAGDLSKWKRMGNTLLLKLAIQITNVNPEMAKSVISTVITGNNYITDNSQDFEVKFLPEVENQNPMYQYEVLYRSDEEMLSLRFLNLMRSLNDTIRLEKMYTKPNGVFIGYDNGATTTAPTSASRSKYGPYVIGTKGEAPVRLITNFQRAFILAEAALTLGTAGDANALYQEGIKASMKKTGMTDVEINNYFTTNPSVVTLSGTTDDKVKQIITEKYIAWVGNGIEAYNDFRRTGYPPLSLALNVAGDDPNTIPKRFPYILSEGQRNPNQPNPRPRTNEKVWWGK
jgi:hypothetical protein